MPTAGAFCVVPGGRGNGGAKRHGKRCKTRATLDASWVLHSGSIKSGISYDPPNGQLDLTLEVDSEQLGGCFWGTPAETKEQAEQNACWSALMKLRREARSAPTRTAI